jgi:hypothetical protein
MIRTPNLEASAHPSEEIAGLDPEKDFERIVFLLTYQLFPWDIERSLELALFNTYAVPSISGLLARTREFLQRPRKRYDDTELLLAEIGENGFESTNGAAALERINAMHGRFKIANDDFLYVLSTFVFQPIEWMAAYGARAFTAKEERAWLRYYQELGRRMGISAIPESLEDFKQFQSEFEQQRYSFAETNRAVARATIDLVVGMYVPGWLIPLGRPVAMALCSKRLIAALGFALVPGWLVFAVQGAMRLRGIALHWLPEPKRLRRITTRRNPTYPGEYAIHELGVGNL